MSAQTKSLKRIKEKGNKQFWKKKALELFQENPLKDFTDWEVVLELGLDEKGYHLVQPRLSDLRREDRIKKTGIERMGRDGVPVDTFIFNPEPKPKPKKLKPIGDKKLFGEMMRTIYAFANKKVAHNEYAMDEALKIWGRSMAEMIREANKTH